MAEREASGVLADEAAADDGPSNHGAGWTGPPSHLPARATVATADVGSSSSCCSAPTKSKASSIGSASYSPLLLRQLRVGGTRYGCWSRHRWHRFEIISPAASPNTVNYDGSESAATDGPGPFPPHDGISHSHSRLSHFSQSAETREAETLSTVHVACRILHVHPDA